jgi:hypothetical protein
MTYPAVPHGWIAVLIDGGLVPTGPYPVAFGPQGLSIEAVSDGDTGSIIVTQSDALDGAEWLHASLAFEHRDPTYRELAALHRAVFGRRRWSYQVFAPAAEHVNIHSHALHLFGRVDGDAVLPDFTRGMGSI